MRPAVRGVGWVQALMWGLVLVGAAGWTSVWHLSCQQQGEERVAQGPVFNTRIVNVGDEMARHSRGDLFVTYVAENNNSGDACYRLGLVAGTEVHVRKVVLTLSGEGACGHAELARATSYTSGGTAGTIVNLNGRAPADKTPKSLAKVTTTTEDLTLVGAVLFGGLECGGAADYAGQNALVVEWEPGEFVLQSGQVLAVKLGGSAGSLHLCAAIYFEEG